MPLDPDWSPVPPDEPPELVSDRVPESPSEPPLSEPLPEPEEDPPDEPLPLVEFVDEPLGVKAKLYARKAPGPLPPLIPPSARWEELAEGIVVLYEVLLLKLLPPLLDIVLVSPVVGSVVVEEFDQLVVELLDWLPKMWLAMLDVIVGVLPPL